MGWKDEADGGYLLFVQCLSLLDNGKRRIATQINHNDVCRFWNNHIFCLALFLVWNDRTNIDSEENTTSFPVLDNNLSICLSVPCYQDRRVGTPSGQNRKFYIRNRGKTGQKKFPVDLVLSQKNHMYCSSGPLKFRILIQRMFRIQRWWTTSSEFM